MSSRRGRPARGKQPAAPARRDPLASLKLADMVISKPFLPVDIIAKIVDYLEVPDLLSFARVSRRMCVLVYDDARWVKRLRLMGCGDDVEAKKIAEENKNVTENQLVDGKRSSTYGASVNGKGRPEIQVNGLPRTGFDHTQQDNPVSSATNVPSVAGRDGFSTIELSMQTTQPLPQKSSREAALTILKDIRAIRGKPRHRYARVYKAFAPLYNDALATVSKQSLIFRAYSTPEQQATMLIQVKIFARSDFSPGADAREDKLKELTQIFATASLLELRQGYEYKDIRGRMRQHAHVLHILDNEQIGIDLFINDNRLILQKGNFGTVGDCIDYSSGRGELSLERVQAYFERLGNAYAQEAAIVQAAFPNPQNVLLPFLEKVVSEILSPFLASLFQDAQHRGASTYLRVMSGTFAAIKQFIEKYTLSPNPDDHAVERTNEVMIRIYVSHIDAYLAEEYTFFKVRIDKEVERWDQTLSEQDASTETFLMSNVNRQAEKKDFMSSFKKVVMAPVSILPIIGSAKSKAPATPDNLAISSPMANRTPSPTSRNRSFTPTLSAEAPTNELAAKAALMTTKLESIKSLFSVEVALNLVHAAKSSLERAAQFISLRGEVGDKARKECSKIFVYMLDAIGNRHVRTGFEKAISHLSTYNPREAHPSTTEKIADQPIVAPLTTFVELVNVGDLIQQMVDVFFESELVAYRIVRRDDFVDAPVKEKRKFEAMLDENVATGLSKGIDVLMDEVEYICGTEQSPTDYNPALFDASAPSLTTMDSGFSGGGGHHSQNNRTSMSLIPDIDITPTPTTVKIIRLISNHHKMLLGTTDKTLLDVFTTELGLRLFQALTKHIKRQRISPLGAIRLLTDLTQYSSFITSTFRNPELNTYFTSLREVGQIFLIECKTDKEIEEMSGIIADQGRYSGVFGVEEVVEFVERRSDWIGIRSKVEGKIRGESCTVM